LNYKLYKLLDIPLNNRVLYIYNTMFREKDIMESYYFNRITIYVGHVINQLNKKVIKLFY